MKKTLRITLIVLGAILISCLFVSQLGILKIYINPSSGNEPNLKEGSKMLVSNLVKPKKRDFVCYNFEDKYSGKLSRVHRLLGMGGDTLEIIEGTVWLNHINVDKETDHVHFYKTTKEEYSKFKQSGNIIGVIMLVEGEFTGQAMLRDNFAISHGLFSQRKIASKGEVDNSIQMVYGQNWNKDNFGPLLIPKGKIFMLGDNRDNSEDSRYLGLIDESAIIGTVMN